ncbi:hypothetical protein AAFN47_10210 [Hoeflea sp. CAU 1731]
MEDLDFDNGEAVAISLSIMPEQLERLQHFADQAKAAQIIDGLAPPLSLAPIWEVLPRSKVV